MGNPLEHELVFDWAQKGPHKFETPTHVMLDDETLRDFRRLKAHMDPNWVLGRGTLFDAPSAG